MIKLISSSITWPDITTLVHVTRRIALIIGNQLIIKCNLRITDLGIIISIVETEAISQGQILDRINICLNLTINLLGIGMIIVILQSPVWVGDSIRSKVSLRSIEWAAQILLVKQRNITWQLIETIYYRCSLECTHCISCTTGKIEWRRQLAPVVSLISITESQCITLVSILITRHDTIITRIGIRQVISHFTRLGNTAQGNIVVLWPTFLEEILHVVLQSLIRVKQLLMVPLRTIHLERAVERRTPWTILDECLATIPTLSETVLHIRQAGNHASLNATTIIDSIVAGLSFSTSLGSNQNDTIGSTATIKSGSSGTLQYGHARNIFRWDIRNTTSWDILTLTGNHVILQRHTINHVKRLVATIDRTITTNYHVADRTWVCAGSVHLNTSHLTRKGISHIGSTCTDNFVAFYCCCSITEGFLITSNTHRCNNNFIKILGIGN